MEIIKPVSGFVGACLVFAFILILAGCEKEEELLEGIWERVIVENINPGFSEEWHFFDGNFTVKRVDNTDSDNVEVLDQGIYRLKPVFDKTYLYINVDRFTWPGYNADWQVITLNQDQLVILHDVYGGITKREFVKKSKD